MVLYLLARIEWQDIKRAWTFFLIFIVVIVGVNALLSGRGGPMSVLQDTSPANPDSHPQNPRRNWTIHITITALRVFFAFTQMMRMFTMAILALPIPYTIDPSGLSRQLSAHGSARQSIVHDGLGLSIHPDPGS